MVFSDKHKLDALSDHELQALDAATHSCKGIQRKSGQSITHGPFAETNEQIGGSFDRSSGHA
jgi:hypothetical protein